MIAGYFNPEPVVGGLLYPGGWAAEWSQVKNSAPGVRQTDLSSNDISIAYQHVILTFLNSLTLGVLICKMGAIAYDS